MLGDLGQRLAEAGPVVLGQPGPRGQGHAQPSVDAARLLGEHHGGGAQRGEELVCACIAAISSLGCAPEELGAVPSRHEVEPVLLENGPELRRAPRELPAELDARVTGLAGLGQAPRGRVVAQRLQVVVRPADGVDADANRPR